MCVTPSEMRTAIRTYDSLRIANEYIKSQERVISEMTSGQKEAEKQIKLFHDLRDVDISRLGNADSVNAALSKSIKLSLDYSSYLKKQLKFAKRKSIIIAGVSVPVITFLSYLLIKK